MKMNTLLLPLAMAGPMLACATAARASGATADYYNPENVTAPVPKAATALEGLWSGNLTHSPLGPSAEDTANLLVVSSADPFGNFYLRHQFITQLMRFQGKDMQ